MMSNSKKEELLILSAYGKVLYSGGKIRIKSSFISSHNPSRIELLNIYFKQMNITRCAKNIKSI